MSKQQQSITSLPQSPDEERRGRMVRYGVAMGVRMVCVILAFFLHGWFQLIAVAGAIILPYFAVVVANVSMRAAGAAVERPGSITRWDDQ